MQLDVRHPAVSRFWRDTEGSVAIIAAVALPILIGIAALALEYGHGLLTRVENQRVSDLASYAGAMAYANTAGTDEDKAASAEKAGKSIGALNGIDPDKVEITFPDSSGDGVFVQADIETTRDLILARILSDAHALNIRTQAVTRVGQSSTACILALARKGQGIDLNGDTFIRADDCGVASNATVTLEVGCSTRIISNESVTYRTSIGHPECVRAPDDINTDGSGHLVRGEVTDYVEERREAMLLAAAGYFSRPLITPAGTSITFGWWEGDPSTRNGAIAAGCDDNPKFSHSKWTIICRNNVSFNSLDIPGGMTVEFVLDGTEEFNVRGRVKLNGGSSLIIGDGSTSLEGINVGGDVETAGGGCIIFGGAESNRIGGNVILGSGAIFRSGLYAINGYVEAGRGGSSCPGSVLFTVQNATLIVNGSNGTSACEGNDAFCMNGGQENISITPPSSDSGIFADVSVIGPLNPTTSRGAAFTNGVSGAKIHGLFYFPYGKMRVDGGASLAPDHCLQLIASEIFVYEGGSVSAGNCPSFAAAGGDEIRLVQ